MFTVIDKNNRYGIYKVYGVRSSGNFTEFLFCMGGSWEWMNASNYEPLKEGVERNE